MAKRHWTDYLLTVTDGNGTVAQKRFVATDDASAENAACHYLDSPDGRAWWKSEGLVKPETALLNALEGDLLEDVREVRIWPDTTRKDRLPAMAETIAATANDVRVTG